jgi:flagellar motor switch/type III secretory pathway protein FliN
MNTVRAFPWERLPRVGRAELAARRELSSRVESSIDRERLVEALGQLLGGDAELAAVELTQQQRSEASAPSLFDCHTLRFPTLGWSVTLWPEPELARACVARLLGQGFELGWADTGIDAALRGAGAALALEVARRAARDEAPELVPDGVSRAEWRWAGHATLRLGGKPYRVELCAEALELGRPAPCRKPSVNLSRLGPVPVRVPWVAAVSTCTVGEIEGLSVGDVWVPGEGAWLAEPGRSAGVLAAPRAEQGLPIRASGGTIVLGAEAVRVHEEPSTMSQEESELTQIVGETPVVVRLELGALEMSAAEWAALKPGDVVQCGRRIEEPVVLRAGGRELARGELVDIDGEIGVRILTIGSATVQS